MNEADQDPTSAAPRLHHACVLAEDLDASIAFYEAALGLQLKARWDKMTFGSGRDAKTVPSIGAFLIDGAGRVIEVFQRPSADKGPRDERPINHFAFEVPDVQAAYDKALAAGATNVRPPTEGRSGGVHGEAAFVAGPDGERIELVKFTSI